MTNERWEPGTPGTEPDPEAERIVSEIELTRAEMGGTIDEIGHRLQPQTIVGNAREQLREATVGRVESVIDDAGRTAQETGNTVIETIRRNPVPAALAAIGIGWLAMRFRDQSSVRYGGHNGDGSRYRYANTSVPGFGKFYGTGYREGPRSEQSPGLYQPRGSDRPGGVRDSAQRAASNVQQAAGDAAYRAQRLGEDAQTAVQDVVQQAQATAEQAQWQVQGTLGQAGRQFDRTLYESPLAVGALAMGVGAAVALALPETQKERELMGEQRDRLLQQASSAAGQVLDQTERKAEEVGSQARARG